MNNKLQEVALEYRKTQSTISESRLAQLIIKRSTNIVTKYSKSYSTYNDGDIDTILTDLFLRVKKNISKWNPELCAFSTWLYSCSINEVRAYYSKQNKYDKRFFATEDMTLTNGTNITYTHTYSETEPVSKYLLDDNAILIHDYVRNSNDLKWQIIYHGEVLAYHRSTTHLSKYFISKKKIGNYFLKHRFGNSTKNLPYYHIKLQPEYAKYKIKQFSNNNELDNFILEQKVNILNDGIHKYTDKKYHNFLKDYFTAKFTYKDLMNKYNLNMQTVKNQIHFNKDILKNKIGIHYDVFETT